MSKVINLGRVIPEIGDNGNWYANGKDLGIAAKGDTGEKGDTGAQGEKGDSGRMIKITNEETTVTEEIQPNCYYSYGEVTSLTLTLATPTDNSVVNEYAFSFDSGTTATTLTLPDTVTWASEPSITASKHYEVSIIDNYGIICGF